MKTLVTWITKPENFFYRWMGVLLFSSLFFFLSLWALLFLIGQNPLFQLYQNLAKHPSLSLLFSLLLVVISLFSGIISFYSFFKLHLVFKESLKTRQETPEIIIKNQSLSRGPKVVAIGGGTGLSTLLTGLKVYTSNITAIVTVTDDGGSSGILRKEFGILPPGDIRNCLCALAQTEPLMNDLFKFRFNRGDGLSGHNFGNLFIAAMTEIMGDFAKSVKASSQILNIYGSVLPVSQDHFNIGARFADGQTMIGETKLVNHNSPIKSVFLEPENINPLPEVLESISLSDLIILGPGSLFTSVIPNLLVPGVAEAINSHPYPCIYICNVMTQPGETDGFSAADHVNTLLDQTPLTKIDYVMLNTQHINPEVLANYQKLGADVVKPDIEEILARGVRVINGNMVDQNNVVRHSPEKLCRILLNLIQPKDFPMSRESHSSKSHES